MQYSLTITQDGTGYHSELHTPLGELHYISRGFDDPEDARQAAQGWANSHLVEIAETESAYLANRDPGDETGA